MFTGLLGVELALVRGWDRDVEVLDQVVTVEVVLTAINGVDRVLEKLEG